jgi:serine/threonine protein phosphatase PrpC
MNKKVLILLCNVTVACLASESNLSIGYCSVGNGKKQEDAFSFTSINGREFFGVYDGHGGDGVANYLKDNLFQHFMSCLETLKTKKEVFESSFRQAEECALQQAKSGSTAVAVYVGKKNMHIAWVGDSRALVVKDNAEIRFVTQDHDLKNKSEWDRVTEAKGLIFRETTKCGIECPWRINCLEMTRSIGDKWAKGKDLFQPVKMCPQPFRQVKNIATFAQQWPDQMLPNPWKLQPLEGQVIADPEYAEIPLEEENRWLILATDGLWKVVENEQASSLVKEKADGSNSVGSLAKILVGEAISKGSNDNITVLVIDLWSRRGK